MKRKSHDYMLRLIIGEKKMNFSMNDIKAAPLMLRMKNIIYERMKIEAVNLPYLTEEDIAGLKENGFADLVGTRINGVLAETARIEILR